MPTFIKDLMQVQFGKQVSFGTAVAATAKMPLVETFEPKPQVEVEEITEMMGNLSPLITDFTAGKWATATMGGVASYEDIAYFLDSFFGVATPGAAPGYVRNYIGPISTFPALRLNTIELVDKQASGVNYQMTGAFANKLTLTQEMKKAFRYSVDLMGHGWTDEATPTALSDRTVTPIMNSHWALWVDAWGGTIGTTSVSTNILSFTLELDSAADLWYSLTGGLNPVDVLRKRFAPSTLTLYTEFDATSKAWVTDGLTNGIIQRQLRLKATGGTNKVFTIDFAGSAKVPDNLTPDENGVIGVQLVFRGKYNSALANWIDIDAEGAVTTVV